MLLDLRDSVLAAFDDDGAFHALADRFGHVHAVADAVDEGEFLHRAAGVAASIVFGLDDVVDEYDRWPACRDESGHGVVPGCDVVAAVAVEARVGEAAGDAVDDGERGGVGVVEGFLPAVEAGGAAGLGAGPHVV